MRRILRQYRDSGRGNEAPGSGSASNTATAAATGPATATAAGTGPATATADCPRSWASNSGCGLHRLAAVVVPVAVAVAATVAAAVAAAVAVAVAVRIGVPVTVAETRPVAPKRESTSFGFSPRPNSDCTALERLLRPPAHDCAFLCCASWCSRSLWCFSQHELRFHRRGSPKFPRWSSRRPHGRSPKAAPLDCLRRPRYASSPPRDSHRANRVTPAFGVTPRCRVTVRATC